jgi:hypothetical protein
MIVQQIGVAHAISHSDAELVLVVVTHVKLEGIAESSHESIITCCASESKIQQ